VALKLRASGPAASESPGKRPIPVWTEKDKRIYFEIKAIVRELFGDALPVGNVVPMLLEANHHE